ncbi:GntR family transcriptional regulator [Saccharopolyspora sp. NPDC002686]|uniref:GntR family transcriptional regulator n=1 Tax=Saccharopolyspora sp. NPDC002686 TaxID=3154541 RepID=UPI00331E36B6
MALIRTLKTQAATELRKLIGEEYRPGDRLPPEGQLAQRIGVSRNTLREALGDLALEGLVERRWGVGTVVRERTGPVSLSLTEIIPVREIIHGYGHEATLPHVAIEEVGCDAELAETLQIEPGTPVWSIERVFAVDGTPAVLMRDWARKHYRDAEFDPHPLSDVDTDLITLIRSAGAPLSRVEGHLDAVEADATTARLLGVKRGRPLVCVTQTCLSERGNVLLHTEVHYRTDVIKLNINRTIRR